ncbi:MAG: ATP-binding cassette domain-containing protein [Levilactobacillus sp.]|uniref:ATP-binding cassette domain-containing protein n=1 Tax=Levilactobacillus suantsaiihabitans TaxID=2487722 RepID=A0A4Z0JEX3_9LACO|nr:MULTISPECIES: ATP-binding cassette domain-containing protein [Levilactobacillus]MCI1553240.1 ATP-binding cassette domain-containing protein [Levilactobacillus sp.]MCI1599403.1 ATP-binding cassette domain-containing protein [Levilactobacillus sp.]TGD20324.1 ATP-binding cassette domain-containing protein [Levilactobacillus suantsaiihabitans]
MTNEAIIQLKDIDVTFHNKGQTVTAVKNVSLTVERGDIYGVVGYSGAGKSTLVRVINRLQRPTAGTVEVNGQDILALKPKELRVARTKIGMIFQHFNLMASRTIADNVGYPLKGGDLSHEERQQKVAHLLDLVGLTEKAADYPAQLSGGQKQRVAIARALANDPEILISDEATSALDPKTTSSILELLKRLNRELGLTVVLITHEMEAVKEICNKVAVMDDGEIIERGDLVTIFSRPEKPLTQDFINTATQVDQAREKIFKQARTLGLDDHHRLVQLQYVGASTDAPLITELYKRYGVVSNILYGNVEILQDTPLGNLIVVMTGDPDKLTAAWQYCQDAGITVTHLQPTDPEVA